MGKLIVVESQKMRAAQMEVQQAIENDPIVREQKLRLEDYFAQERVRLDAAFAAKQPSQTMQEA
jgi:hypothetical protein